jgi:type IV secretion system protein VirB6
MNISAEYQTIIVSLLSDLIPSMEATLGDLSNLYFFSEINKFLTSEIEEYGRNLLGRTMSWASAVALALTSLWIVLRGIYIAYGRSKETFSEHVLASARVGFVVAAATTMVAFGTDMQKFLGHDMVEDIHNIVSGQKGSPYDSIDQSLGYMQLALSSIDLIDTGGDEVVADAKTRAQWFTGIGVGGPALVGGTMLLLFRIAIAIFVGLGPIFILCLMFDSTKPLFQRWLLYGIGTMFSLAVMSVMVSLALDVTIAVAASFWTGSFLGANPEGVSSLALQQGAVGMILTVLIVSAPPIAANFFQGTLAQYSAYNVFGANRDGKMRNSYQQTLNQPQSQPTFAPRPAIEGSLSGMAPRPQSADAQLQLHSNGYQTTFTPSSDTIKPSPRGFDRP